MTWRRRVICALALGVAVVASPAMATAANEPDPFYLDLERTGRAALARGDATSAARKLRIACFGLLDAPPRLAACLVRLGLAQARAGDQEAFARTFERLDGVEERFEVYAGAPLEADERTQFEARLADWVSPETLAARPAFRSVTWLLKTREARKTLAARRFEEALAMLDGIPSWFDDGNVGCLRGEALAQLGRCSEAVGAFAVGHAEREARFAAPALACLTNAGRLAEASRLAATLPDDVRSDRAVRRRLSELEAATRRSRP